MNGNQVVAQIAEGLEKILFFLMGIITRPENQDIGGRHNLLQRRPVFRLEDNAFLAGVQITEKPTFFLICLILERAMISQGIAVWTLNQENRRAIVGKKFSAVR